MNKNNHSPLPWLGRGLLLYWGELIFTPLHLVGGVFNLALVFCR